jgi:NADH-quinone oxidoreductase subunit E
MRPLRKLRRNFLMNLKPATLQKIDEVIPHYPVKRSAALPLLHLVQEDAGWISPEAVEWIAGKLELEPINLYELVTFYPMFRQHPAGRRHVKVCRTLSCALAGAHAVGAELARGLGCAAGETSADGAVSLEYVECLASCGTGPVVMVDEELHERVDAAMARALAARIRKEAGLARIAEGTP